jgi:hypothetical protein
MGHASLMRAGIAWQCKLLLLRCKGRGGSRKFLLGVQMILWYLSRYGLVTCGACSKPLRTAGMARFPVLHLAASARG